MLVIDGTSYSAIARRFDLQRDAIRRHARAHLAIAQVSIAQVDIPPIAQANAQPSIAHLANAQVLIVPDYADDPPPTKRCTICRSDRFWQRPLANGRGWVCCRCHPYFGAEVVQVVTVTSYTR
jgi:hypothetical protein